MKFMKLGSKPDQFQTDGDTIRYIATDLATDIVISVGDVKFYLHKFPLLSKSSQLQKLVASTSDNNDDGIDVHDIPGGPAAFEICAKFCYGMVVTLNAYNVVMARCAAEYLEMFETVEKGNLVYKIDVFLTSSIFRSWKDSIIVLQTTKSFLPWSEELKIVSHCLDSIATRASTNPSKVDWSYTYNRKKLPSENGDELHWNGVKKQQAVPKDWWVEDLCELQIDLYKRVITTIRAKGRVSADVVGESLKAYASRRLPVFGKSSTLQGSEILKHRYLVDTIIWLLPMDKSCVPCSFMLKLLQASMMLECDETGKQKLLEKIGQQLEEATVSDLMIRSETGETALVNIDVVHDLVAKFLMQENGVRTEYPDDPEFQQICPGFTSDASKAKVAKLIDSYMAEAARDSLLSLSKFFDLAEMTSNFPRSSHDGIYRAIDMYLKEHPGLTKSEKKRICRLMDCRKLSGDASAHAVQNERLPLRVVVQILFFEQARAAAAGATGSSTPTPNLPGSVRAMLPRGSCGSSRSTTTNSDEDWDGDHTSEELASLRLGNRGGHNGDRGVTVNDAKLDTDRVTSKKVKKIFSRLWSHKDGHGENSSSDTSASTSVEEMKEVAVVVKTMPNQSKKNSLLTR